MTKPRSPSRRQDDRPKQASPDGQDHASRPTRVPRVARTPADPPRVTATQAPDDIRGVILGHIADAVFATDSFDRVTFWSASAARLFRVPSSEAVGRPFGELLTFQVASPEDEQTIVEELAAGRTWRGRGTVRLRDGSEMWLESNVQPIVDKGRVVGSVSVARDISATVDAQRHLADQEQFINAILDVEGALVMVLDTGGRVVLFNGACERVSGYSSAEVVGRPIWDVIPPDEAHEVKGMVAELQAGAFPHSHENHWVTRAGTHRLIAWENTCLTDAQGAVTHVIATGIDVTEARRADDALRGIETVGRLLAEQGPVPSTLDAILGELEARMGYRFLAVYLRDTKGLRLGAQRGYASVPEHLDVGTGVIGRAYRTGRSILVADVRTDPDYVSGAAAVVGEIAVPLRGDDETVGVLNIESAQPGVLTEGDMRLAGTIADRLSTALLRNAEQEALRDRVRLFASLSAFAGVANSILDPERLAAALVEAVGAVVPSDTIVITTRGRSDQKYRVRAVRGLIGEVVGTVIRPGDGNTGRAIVERVVVMSDHHPRAQYASSLREHVAFDSIYGIAVPLVREDMVIGVISVGRAGPDATFSDAELEVIALLGSQAALALANAFLVEEVSTLAIRDGLTGLHNRRHFDAELELAIARCKRRGATGQLAAIMFDLDHFGQFNRDHGHLAGDAVLRLFGKILRERLRSADLVARYGGEEFVAILEDAGLADAVRVAEEIRLELEGHSVPGPDGEPLRATVSAGCTAIDLADPTPESLIGRADTGLFMAKRAGRNRVVAA